MSLAVWKLSWREGRGVWLALAALTFGFHWIHVWVVGQMDADRLRLFLEKLPDVIMRMLPVDVRQMASPQGRLASAYDHPIVAFGCLAWAVTRGSDAVSGPLGRGTLEMVLSQPVSRVRVLLVNAATTTLGTLGLCGFCWLGTLGGVATVPAFAHVSPLPYLWTAANLFAVTFFLAGVATLASAADRHRWRTIGLVSGLYVVAILLKVVGRASPSIAWIQYGSFLSLFEPQRIIGELDKVASNCLIYDLPLLALGVAAYVAAAVVFARRDLPAPL